MNTSVFAKKLYGTVIPANIPLTEQVKKNEALFNYVQKKMPKTLFRYRSCNERNLEAFYKDYVWVSSPNTMNDGFDTRLYFDIKEILDKRDQMVTSIRDQWQDIFKPGIQSPFPLTSFAGLEQGFQNICNASESHIREYITQFCDLISNEIDFATQSIISLPQNVMKIECLSERNDSSLMWGNYAYNETGFVLGYDCRDLSIVASNNPGSTRPFACWPVIYSDERFQVPNSYIEYMILYRLMNHAIVSSGYFYAFPQDANRLLSSIVCPDILIPAKIALHKSMEWKVESEWRLFCVDNGYMGYGDKDHKYFIMKPSEVYLGRRISSLHEKILTDLAKEKNIPVYKMRLIDTSPKYILLPEPK